MQLSLFILVSTEHVQNDYELRIWPDKPLQLSTDVSTANKELGMCGCI